MCSRGFFQCVEQGKKRRAGYQTKYATLNNEPKLTICYGERSLPSQDKDKPTLFFIHGLMNTKGTWYTVTRHMPSTQHAICVDLPGHGGSSWKDDDDLNTAGIVKRLHEFIKTIKLHKITGGIHMVGHSWGALIAGEFAFKYGEEDGVKFLTMISLPVHGSSTGELMVKLKQGEFNSACTPEDAEGMRKIYRTVFHKKRHWNTMKWFWKTQFELKQPQFPHYRMIWQKIEEEITNASLCTMRLGLWKNFSTIPMHVIWGKQDKVFASEGADIVSDALQCRMAKIENTGHYVQQEGSKKVAEEMLDFRKKCIANR